MKTETEVIEYLARAEDKAIKALAAKKWERFGYWASQSVHLRRILGLSNTPSPFKEFAELARKVMNGQGEKCDRCGKSAGGVGFGPKDDKRLCAPCWSDWSYHADANFTRANASPASWEELYSEFCATTRKRTGALV